MKPSSVKFFQKYFKDKICTIITHSINRNFKEETLRDHYVIFVEEINEDGVFGHHPYYNNRSYYPLESIISIHQEIMVSKQEAEKLEKMAGKKMPSDMKLPGEMPKPTPENSTSFASLEEIVEVAKITKEKERVAKNSPFATLLNINNLVEEAKQIKNDYNKINGS